MQQRTGEHHSATGAGAIGASPEFWEAELRPFVVLVQVHAECEATMRSTLGGVVTVWFEMAAVVFGIAGDNVPFHTCDIELKGLANLRHDSTDHSLFEGVDQRLIVDAYIAPLFVRVINRRNGEPLLLTHEP